jgi:cytochrome c biogenesis protein
MIGLIQGMYWNHRRIWIQRINGEVLVAAHTNKNWFGLKKELAKICEGTPLVMPVDQADKGR